MTTYLLIIAILFFLCSAVNYVSYNHVKRYKYYKSVGSASLSQYLVGIALGIPLIVVPFAARETDKDFMKYSKIKNSVLLSRFLILALILSIIAFGVSIVLR